jgi:predicted negative regulator of RcsB-dependent stress response
MLAVGLLLAIETTASAQPTPQEIARAIKQLGDDSFEVRQNASMFLRSAGKAAEPLLEQVVKNTDDKEIERRAREILEDFRWGLYPDTPKKVADLIQQYRGADDAGKRAAAQEMLKQGGSGFHALIKIAAAEPNDNLRREIQDELARNLAEAMGDLVLQGDFSTLEGLVEAGLHGERESAYRNYAAWLHFRGKLDDKLAHWKSLAEKNDAKAAEIVCFLARAKGNLDLARWGAEKSANPRLLPAILLERRDWPELARTWNKNNPDNFGIEGPTLNVAYQRLAGNAEGLEKALAELRKFIEAQAADSNYLALGAKALFLNDRPDEALALLTAGKQYQPAFEILCFQGKYREAFALIGKLDDLADRMLPVQLSAARVLHLLGERDKARQLFHRLPDLVEARDQYPTARDLLRIQVRTGLKDDAFAFAGRLLKKETFNAQRDSILSLLFPDQAGPALTWWNVLRRRYTPDQSEEILKQQQAIWSGKLTGKELDDLLKHAESLAGEFGGNEQALLYAAMAEAAVTAGNIDQAIAHLVKAADKATDAAPLLRLGDLQAGKKAWNLAAKTYRKAWEKDRTQPLGLFLSGWSLVQAGQEADGRQLMEIAHALPLGNEFIRYHFARSLSDRGLSRDADRERDLIFKVGALDGWAVNEALRSEAYAAQYRKEHGRAADLFDAFCVRCMKASVSFVEFSAQVQVPHLVHTNRALALVSAGKFDEARQHWQMCWKLAPTSVQMPLALLPVLEKVNRRQDADQLFNQVFDQLGKICSDYPGSASNHNTIAWLAAVSRRKLDDADRHASKAVELEPANAGYIDTLAEVQFQRGNSARAIDLIRRCLEIEPRNSYFQKQLQRFQAGDPKAPVPDES